MSVRSMVVFLPVLLFLSSAGLADEKIPLFIQTPEFMNLSAADKGTYNQAVAEVLAMDLQAELNQLKKYRPMTRKDLKSQLAEAKFKTLLGCKQHACVAKMLTNVGVAHSLTTTLTRMGNQFHVRLAYYTEDEVANSATAVTAADMISLSATMKQLAAQMFGATPRRTVTVEPVGGPVSTGGMGTLVKDTGVVVVLEIRSSLPGTEVSMNGRYLGVAPVKMQNVPAGQYRVKFKKSGCRSDVQDVRLQKGKHRVIEGRPQKYSRNVWIGGGYGVGSPGPVNYEGEQPAVVATGFISIPGSLTIQFREWAFLWGAVRGAPLVGNFMFGGVGYLADFEQFFRIPLRWRSKGGGVYEHTSFVLGGGIGYTGSFSGESISGMRYYGMAGIHVGLFLADLSVGIGPKAAEVDGGFEAETGTTLLLRLSLGGWL